MKNLNFIDNKLPVNFYFDHEQFCNEFKNRKIYIGILPVSSTNDVNQTCTHAPHESTFGEKSENPPPIHFD